ncbi:MAG: hypothetical protein GXO89_13685 [Chlorobi bacterium]|nr:hypothetical protein [Chlorobiota bacterium]
MPRNTCRHGCLAMNVGVVYWRVFQSTGLSCAKAMAKIPVGGVFVLDSISVEKQIKVVGVNG